MTAEILTKRFLSLTGQMEQPISFLVLPDIANSIHVYSFMLKGLYNVDGIISVRSVSRFPEVIYSSSNRNFPDFTDSVFEAISVENNILEINDKTIIVNLPSLNTSCISTKFRLSARLQDVCDRIFIAFMSQFPVTVGELFSDNGSGIMSEIEQKSVFPHSRFALIQDGLRP